MSFRKLGENKYRIEVEATIDGKRRRKSKVIHTKAKKKDLQFLVSNTEAELSKELRKDLQNLGESTFEAFTEYFLNTSTARQRTKDFYQEYFERRTRDFFKGKKIREIKKYHIEQFIHELSEETSQATGKKLSAKTIKHYRDLLRVIFNRAIELEIRTDNPADSVKIPPVKRNIAGKYYELEEIEKMISALKLHGIHKYLVFYILQLYTGARPSEIYGLKWEKIDFESGAMTINEALVETKAGYEQNRTKTSDERIIGLSPYILGELKELKNAEQIKHNKEDINKEYIFTNQQGGFLHQGAFRNYLRRFCTEQNLRYVPPYGIRHTTGTVLSASKIPLVNISNVLGHTTTKTTEIYVHPTERINAEIRGILADITTPK